MDTAAFVWNHTVSLSRFLRPFQVPIATMPLSSEIELNRSLASREEELLLALVHTNQLLDRASGLFLGRFELTATQFNALMIVRDWEVEGITQTELARRLLINRASAGSLIDSLSERGLLERTPAPGDRRAYHLGLTRQGRRLLKAVLDPYYRRLASVFGPVSSSGEAKAMLRLLDTLRVRLRDEIRALDAEGDAR